MILSTSRPTSHGVVSDSPFADAKSRFVAGRMGMLLFLASLSMLFVAGLIGYAIIRVQLPEWPRDLPSRPSGQLHLQTTFPRLLPEL